MFVQVLTFYVFYSARRFEGRQPLDFRQRACQDMQLAPTVQFVDASRISLAERFSTCTVVTVEP